MRLDIVVADKLILEIKACDALLPIHEAQLLTYLKLTGIKIGLLAGRCPANPAIHGWVKGHNIEGNTVPGSAALEGGELH